MSYDEPRRNRGNQGQQLPVARVFISYMRLQHTAMSSTEDALSSITLLAEAVKLKPAAFPHLAEVASFWLARRTAGKILVPDDTSLLDFHGACLDALATYAAMQSTRAPGILQNLSNLLPTLIEYASQLLSEFSENMDELTMPQYIPPFFDSLAFILNRLSELDCGETMYTRFMTPALFPLAFKAWIKVFAHLEFYGNAPESIYRLLLPRFEARGVESGEASAPVLSAIPFPVVVKCIHNITPVLRDTGLSSDSLAPPLMFLTATSISATPFRCILLRHGALASVLVLLRRLIRNRSFINKEQQFVPSCITFLQFGVSESERWLYDLLRMGFLEVLIRCHDPENSDDNVTGIVSEMINTVTVHCTNPDVFRRVQRTLPTIDVNMTDMPLAIRRSWSSLEDTITKLAPFMALGAWRQFRVCSNSQVSLYITSEQPHVIESRQQCQKGSCQYCCTRCLQDFYCSTRCQKADFARHRPVCLEIAELHRSEVFSLVIQMTWF